MPHPFVLATRAPRSLASPFIARYCADLSQKKNLEIVRNIYGLLNRIGTATFLALPDTDRRAFYKLICDPELEIIQSAELVFDTDGTFHGYDGFIKVARELVEGLGDINFDADKGFESGDTVVCEVRARATGSGSGVPVELSMAHLWELREGLACRWVVYPTVGEALEAAGMQE